MEAVGEQLQTGKHPAESKMGRVENWRAWRQARPLLAGLRSEVREERETAIAWFVEQGEAGLPCLRRALRGPMTQACGAAVALQRMNRDEGIRVVLRRCYDEEWLVRCFRDGHVEGLSALRWLGHDAVGEAVQSALDGAEQERDALPCLAHLTLALSGLRVLSVFDGPSPRALWERALFYGHHNLRALRQSSYSIFARNLTDSVRALGLRGLLMEYSEAGFAVLSHAFRSSDTSVRRTAVQGMQRLRDPRALPLLQEVAFVTGNPLAAQARTAIERIAGVRADSLILLRSSEPDESPEELLRPAPPVVGKADALLLRPIARERLR